eukprot:79804_1
MANPPRPRIEAGVSDEANQIIVPLSPLGTPIAHSELQCIEKEVEGSKSRSQHFLALSSRGHHYNLSASVLDSQLISNRGDESSDEEVYDPESEGPFFDRQISEIPDEYEHKHSPDGEEFRLIPHHGDSDKWKIFIPIIYWLPRYKWREWFVHDVMAAITAIVMVIPQGMGYAMVAGLSPIYGLYSALMGHCLYGPFGTSGQLIVAPVAIVSLMTREALHHYFADADASDPEIPAIRAAYGSALAFQSGCICLLGGLLKAGILANMLAEPVIVGFTFAAAILIAISQLQFVCDVELHGEEVVIQLRAFFAALGRGEAHKWSIVLAVCCITFLLIMRCWKNSSVPSAKYAKFIPSALILVVICTAISWRLGDSTGWNIVGELPRGLPSFVNFLDVVDPDDFWELWTPAILITLLAFIESIAVATKFADKHDYSIDASQELIALGICNLIGCWFQIYPVSGVLSLATVVEAAGALTPLYCCMAGCGMIVTTAFFLFLFEWLPKPVLGSIVLVGIINLVDIPSMRAIWKINRKDSISMIITILVTLFIGIDYGVALGVAASIVLFIQKAAKPHYGVLGRIPYADVVVYRNVKHHKDTQTRADMLMIRWDASIFFANTASFKTRIRKQIGRHLDTHCYPPKWCLALCFSGVNDIDYSGVEMLKSFFAELKQKEKGMTLILCKVKTQVLCVLEAAGVVDIIGKNHILWELHEAEDWWNSKILSGTSPKILPKMNDLFAKMESMHSKSGVNTWRHPLRHPHHHHHHHNKKQTSTDDLRLIQQNDHDPHAASAGSDESAGHYAAPHIVQTKDDDDSESMQSLDIDAHGDDDDDNNGVHQPLQNKNNNDENNKHDHKS